jgi:very-short-patch-repair endonuclease
MQSGFAFSHVTAAELWGIPLPRGAAADIRIHVSSVDGKARPRLRGVVGHELSDKRMCVTMRANLPVVDAATTWLQLTAVLPFDDLVIAGDHLVLTPRRSEPADPRPHVGLEMLADRVLHFRGRGRRLAVLALPFIRDGSESPKETELRLRLQARNLPEPDVNGVVFDDEGVLIGYGDLVYRPWKVVVEYDGEHHRVDSRQYYRDIERHEGFVGAGWIHIRETKETPPTGPRSTLARTEGALRARGWRP